MQFIDVIDKKGRVSGFNIGKQKDFIEVRGNLEHCSQIRPQTKADALLLIEWLKSLNFN